MKYITNPQLQLAFNYVEYTGKNIFLTGKAGTGKTTFLHNLKTKTSKRLVVVAPTGVAAINAGGVTIHSFFQIAFGPAIPEKYFPGYKKIIANQEAEIKRFSKQKINIIRSLDLLVIDEISMVRADLLDSIDAVLRRFKDKTKPFGGLQLLMIGDIQQLDPIIKDNEWTILRNYYDTKFFFSSKALMEATFESIELTHVFRQSDEVFISMLNKIRDNKLDSGVLNELNKRFIPDFSPDDKKGYITLTTHNIQSDTINERKLKTLKNPSRFFEAFIDGNFPEHLYPTKENLELKVGAQVMFIKNDPSPEKKFFNGKIGQIIEFEEDTVFIQCPNEEEPIAVETLEWENYKYELDENTKEIKEKVDGLFAQIPLKLAWAITIHKSQGLTFDRAIIDAQSAFAHGQVYVALSRCRTLEGLVLSSRLSPQGIISDYQIDSFSDEVSENQPTENDLNEAKIEYRKNLVKELFTFDAIAGQFFYLLKIARINENIIFGNVHKVLSQVKEAVENKLKSVGEKFLAQVNHLLLSEPDVEQNKDLQNRISKASIYFVSEISENIMDPLEMMNIESDNTKVKKDLNNALENLVKELEFRLKCLEACKKGFNTEKYQRIKALAGIEEPKKKKRKKKLTEVFQAKPKGDGENAELIDRLKSWRHKKAMELQIPHYMIMHQKALLAIATYIPQSLTALRDLPGFGKKTVEKYGEELIEITLSYCKENDIPITVIEEPEEVPKKAKKKKDTKLISLEMFRNGMEIEEIVEERGFVKKTIEGHLAFWVGTGDLDVKELVPETKIKTISAVAKNIGLERLTPIKEELGDDYSFSEIQFVVESIKSKGL